MLNEFPLAQGGGGSNHTAGSATIAGTANVAIIAVGGSSGIGSGIVAVIIGTGCGTVRLLSLIWT